MSSKSPEIRFNGYTDDWEQRELSSISEETYGGGTPKTKVKEYWQGDFPWIQSSDLKQDELSNVIPKKFISKEAIQNSATKIIPEMSIAIVTRVGVGKLAFIPYSFSTSQDFLSLSNLRIDSQFGVYSIYKMLQKELSNIQGTSIKGITKSDLLNKKIHIPNKPNEQKKIGDFFKSLDETIALHQRELDNLIKSKKGFLQKMFPKRGEMIPELRFSEYSNEWNSIKLGKIGTTYSGLSGKTKEDFGHGEAEFVTYKNVFSNAITNINETENVEIDEKQNRVQYGDVFFTTSSETPEEVGMSSVWLENKDNTYLNSFCFGFRPTDNVNYLYLAYLLRSSEVRKQFIILAQGISRYNISKKKTMDIILMIPNLEEQEKIGTFFKQLDDKIDNKQQQLDNLKQTKKAFLQKMFV